MKLTYWVMAFFWIIGLSASAQSAIPNGDFENWVNVGPYEDPLNWESSNKVNYQQYGIATITKTADSYSGLYAVKLQTGMRIDSIGGGAVVIQMFNSYLTSQRDTLTSSLGGFPYQFRPTKLSGHFKYLPYGDSCAMGVLLTRSNGTSFPDLIGFGIYKSGSITSNYSYFEAPIQYLSTQTPDSAYIVLSPNEGDSTNANTVLYVDNLQFGGLTGIEEAVETDNQLNLYPNPASEELFFSIPEEDRIAEIRMNDLLGRRVATFRKPALSAQNKARLSVKELPDGIYIMEAETSAGKIYQHSIMIRR